MNLSTTALARRRILLAPLAGGIAWLAGSLAKPAAAQEKASLIAKRVDRVPDDPGDELWLNADILEVPMAPQVVVKPRTYEASVKAVKTRALYDDEQIAFLLEWGDSELDARIGGVDSFRDAIALEFPGDPADGIPYFGMGEANKPVTIYQWKADWQFSENRDVDEENPNMATDWYPFSGREAGEIAEPADYGSAAGDKAFHTSWWSDNLLGDLELHARTSVEKLQAEGFGTVTPMEIEQQDASGTGSWKDGVWKVVISIPRSQEQFAFEPGKTVPLAFAAWNGAAGERGGEKAISTWYFLTLDQPVGTIAYVAPVVALVGAGAIQAWGLRVLRRKASGESGSPAAGADSQDKRT